MDIAVWIDHKSVLILNLSAFKRAVFNIDLVTLAKGRGISMLSSFGVCLRLSASY